MVRSWHQLMHNNWLGEVDLRSVPITNSRGSCSKAPESLNGTCNSLSNPCLVNYCYSISCCVCKGQLIEEDVNEKMGNASVLKNKMKNMAISDL